MDTTLREKFIDRWNCHFGPVMLPIVFYFSEGTGGAEQAGPALGHHCLIGELMKVQHGRSFFFNAGSIACGGAKRYLGYSSEISPTFRYFLSCGIPGKVKGERYKISPEVVDETQKHLVQLPSAGKNIVFKRWDKLDQQDEPEVVIFFVRPEILSGLFTLSNFDQVDPLGVITPFSSGCGSIIHYPWLEQQKENPKCVLGMFDPSARSYVPADVLSFAIPMKRFVKLVEYMDESFLTTPAWEKIKRKYIRNLYKNASGKSIWQLFGLKK